MGNNNIRKLIKSEQKWVDKNAPRHRHDYSIHSVARVTYGDGRVCYFDVMKCKNCYSFKSIPRPNAIDGFIHDFNIPTGVPIINLYKSHKTIGFGGAILMEDI